MKNGVQSLFNSELSEQIPEETKWKQISTCCGSPVIRLMPSDRVFCKYWEMSFCMPVLVVILTLISYFTFWISNFPELKSGYKTICPIIATFFLIMFQYTYFSAACKDPGYLPYDWIRTRKFKYDWPELMSGLAIREDQKKFAQKYKPPFASFSNSTGLYIIRADHICGWVTNWIGKRNHKDFILMLFYGFLYSLFLIISRFFVKDGNSFLQSGYIFLSLMSFSIELLFSFLLLSALIENLFNAALNKTSVSEYKGRPNPNNGCLNSCSEICGDNSVC